MKERRRSSAPQPVQKARRAHAENQARGQRARTHLERARKRRRSALARQARSGRRGDRVAIDSPALRRALIGCAFVASALAGALFGTPLIEATGLFGDGAQTRIERIAVQGNRLLSSRDVAAASGVEPGQPGREVEPDAVGERLRAHPWIRDAHVMRLPPGKLLIKIEERAPVALLASSGATLDASWRYVDDTGTPFARSNDPGPSMLDDQTSAAWPRLRGGEQLEDDRSHPELAAALALTRQLRAGGLGALLGAEGGLEVHMPAPADPRGWVVHSGPGRPLVILGHEGLTERVDRLEALLRSQIAELRDATEIDLRFADRAVLRSDDKGVSASS